jgi:hypothetical protein
MIYTDDWAFLHIPKNAGVNFKRRVPKELVRGTNYLPKNIKSKDCYYWHQPISYQLKNIPQLDNLPWITIVRHPADRLLSWFNFIKKRRTEQNKTPWNITFESFIKDNGIKYYFNEFIDDKHPWSIFVAEKCFWKPYDLQCKWIYELDNIDVKCFRKEDEFEKMEDYVGFKFSDTQYNSTIHDSWETYYTDEMREIVYERYKEDYERLGYGT